jgi:TonB family protein
MLKRNIFFCLISLCFLSIFTLTAKAQEISFNHLYSFGQVEIDEAPQVKGFFVAYPDEARKNGVEGTLKASLVLGENGKVRDIKILQTLPFGVEAVVVKALENLPFQPARLNGQPVAVPLTFEFVVTAIYDDGDKNVTKPQLLEKPAPVYPAKYAAQKIKGKVSVMVICYTDGKVKVAGVGSVMPREFDDAAVEAAGKIRFQPAVHKKSKAAVTQKMVIEYDFKP